MSNSLDFAFNGIVRLYIMLLSFLILFELILKSLKIETTAWIITVGELESSQNLLYSRSDEDQMHIASNKSEAKGVENLINIFVLQFWLV